jgi:hypothetical protein
VAPYGRVAESLSAGDHPSTLLRTWIEVVVNAKRRFLPRHSTLVAYVALFVALGGTTYAAVSLPKNSVGTKQLKDGAVTSSKLNANATISHANRAANADRLGGSPAAAFLLRCPTGMLRAGNLCVDFAARPPATLANALQTCASAGLRLADAGELALAFNNLGAPQPYEWTGATTYIGATEYGQLLADNPGREIAFSYGAMTLGETYRCVSSPSN